MLDAQSRRLTDSTMQFYRVQLRPFAEWRNDYSALKITDVTPTIMRGYLVSLQDRGLSDYSQHAAARSIKALLGLSVREGWLPESPMTKVIMPKVGKRIPPAFTADVLLFRT